MERNVTLIRKALAVLLPLFIAVFAVLHVAMPDRSFSEAENRVLLQLPRFSLKALMSGQFTADFDQYVSDQFVFRDAWIGVKTDVDRALGKKENGGVFLAGDGYLIQTFNPPSEADVEKRAEAILAFDRATPELRKYVMLVPTAATVLQDKLPPFASAGDELQYLDRMRSRFRGTVHDIDVYPALDAMREKPIFYQTDHHWTTLGAYTAYVELCKHLGLNPLRQDEFDIRQATDHFYGSLYSTSGFRHLRPDRIELYWPKDPVKYTVTYVDEGLTTDSLYAVDQLEAKDKYAVFLNGNHGLVEIKTAHPSRKKLLLVKDSYANSLIPFLLPHFSEIDVVDLRYYEEDLASFAKARDFDDMLLLYNANTFFEDSSILTLHESE